MRRWEHSLLTAAFLGVIFAVPVAQALIDKLVEKEDKPVFLTLFDKAPTEKHLRAFEQQLEDSSYFEQRLRPLFQLGRYELSRDLGEKALRGAAADWYFYHPGVKYLVEPYFRDLRTPPDTDPLIAIRDFARQLSARGIALLVVPVPGKASVYPEKLVSAARLDPAVAGNTLRFAEELRRAGLNVLDLHRAFWRHRAAAPGEQLYMGTDTHWTGHGVKLAAAAIAEWIRSHPGLVSREVNARRYVRKRVQLWREGDIPRMTRIPHRERLFPKERVVAFRVLEAQSGERYEDPEEPGETQILLLGDSFARVFQTDAPEAAGLIANLAYELQRPLSSIVNDGGASTLVRQELARDLELLQGKRLVIWAFVERDIRFGNQGWQVIELEP